ncbi:hypothetical protein KLP28_05655 [Nocardioidaceae bacterium]|nr:hypothetical protein KLP28_05655 [Nocardioidaceae bacterium]
MAENHSTDDDTSAADETSTEGSDGSEGGFLSRFGGGFATIAGGLAAFVLMIGIGGYVAFQLLGGPGEGSAPGPLSATAPSTSGNGGNGGNGGSGGGGSGSSGGNGGVIDVQNPNTVREPDDQTEFGVGGNGLPTGTRQGDFVLRLNKEAAEPYETVVWRGTFRGQTGRTLTLQNKVGPNWIDYREKATVQGNGRYRGTLVAGLSGVDEFRVVDPRSGQVSNVAKVEIY